MADSQEMEKKCCRCGEFYPVSDLRLGVCEDCLDDLSGMDLEDQIDDLLDTKLETREQET